MARRLAESPEEHGPLLRALLADAAEARRLESATTLRVCCARLERRLHEVEQKCSGGQPPGPAT